MRVRLRDGAPAPIVNAMKYAFWVIPALVITLAVQTTAGPAQLQDRAAVKHAAARSRLPVVTAC